MPADASGAMIESDGRDPRQCGQRQRNLDGRSASRATIEAAMTSAAVHFRSVGGGQEGARTGLLGPFSVSPRQIMDLGTNFATFVNELLRVELASAGLSGGHLTTTYRENLSDQGVDAGLRHATETRYLPAGDSAWQFKAGDLPPDKCRAELRKATAALDVLRSGGVYRLVLGADLTPAKVRRRRTALEEEAAQWGIDAGPDTFVVLNASDLADWASGYPALALSPLVGGLGKAAVPFDAWSRFRTMGGPWADSPSRQNLAAEVRRTITDPTAAALHVEGVSGVGKTRAVLEAVRGQDFEALVVYVPAADRLTPLVLQSLHTHERQAVVIVDECDARQHELLSEQLPSASTIKLITIGEPSGYRPPVRPYRLEGLEPDALWTMIRAHQPALPREHCQVVVDTADGNAKLARLLANDIVGQPRSTVVELLTEDVIGSFVTRALPGGSSFLACCVLALLPAVGFDDGPGYELACLAAAFDMTANDLRVAASDLDRASLISRQGRYRAVAPYPLALYLAAHAWRDLHSEIEQRLLPTLDVVAAERLFRRAVDSGVLDTARTVVERLLAPGGLYARLDVWGRGAESMLLVHFGCSRASSNLQPPGSTARRDDRRTTVWRTVADRLHLGRATPRLAYRDLRSCRRPALEAGGHRRPRPPGSPRRPEPQRYGPQLDGSVRGGVAHYRGAPSHPAPLPTRHCNIRRRAPPRPQRRGGGPGADDR
jgi:hypothetical protein